VSDAAVIEALRFGHYEGSPLLDGGEGHGKRYDDAADYADDTYDEDGGFE
jgi:hypothetical protein